MARRSIVALATIAVLLLAAAPAFAEDAYAAGRNVLLTIKLGKIAGKDRQVLKEYQLVLTENTAGSRLLSGARVPLRTETHGEDPKAASFTYQNIGFTVTAEAHPAADGRIALRALLEDSRIREQAAPTDDPPVVETRQLSVEVTLVDGKPMEITRVEGVADEPGFVEVRADVLD
jgi:hypothetical protein